MLLKNDNKALPLFPGEHTRVAVVGPHAVSQRALLGDFYEDAFCPGVTNRSQRAEGCVPQIGASLEQVLRASIGWKGEVRIEPGCDIESTNATGIAAAVAAAAWADVVVLAVGYDNKHIEHESSDHPNVTLPGL